MQINPPLASGDLGTLIGIATHMFHAQVARALAPHDLTWPQFSLLMHLSRKGGAQRVSDLAAAVDLTQPAATKIVQKFTGLGWVAAEADRSDGRNRPIRLTATGHEVLTRVQTDLAPLMEALLDGWPAQDRADLGQVLGRLIRSLDRLKTPIPPSSG